MREIYSKLAVTDFTYYFDVSIVNFEQVNAGWTGGTFLTTLSQKRPFTVPNSKISEYTNFDL